jgi:hypothetical protein
MNMTLVCGGFRRITITGSLRSAEFVNSDIDVQDTEKRKLPSILQHFFRLFLTVNPDIVAHKFVLR